ncbi:MAG TPA: hypothetical protein VGF30_04715 [Bacteroidia bacterium]
MKLVSIKKFSLLLCVIYFTSGYAQTGLLGKIKDAAKKEDKSELQFPGNFYWNQKNYLSGVIEKDKNCSYRMEALKKVNKDSIVAAIAYYEANKKKFSGNDAIYAEGLKTTYNDFGKKFEEVVIPDFNDYIESTKEIFKAADYYFIGKEYEELTSASKKIYTGKVDLAALQNKIANKRKEYAAALKKAAKISCEEQLEHLNELRFASSENGCLKGVTNETVTGSVDNGVSVYFSTRDLINEYRKSITLEIYIDDKKAGSIYFDVSEYSEKKEGWVRVLLIPGLKNFNSDATTQRSIYNSLSKKCKVTVKNKEGETMQGSFIYDISTFNGSVSEYFDKVELEYYKTVKFPQNAYKDATLEKTALDYYNTKWAAGNKVKGKAIKVVIEGNNWSQRRTSAGVLTGRYTTAYYGIKGDDGNCYFFSVRIDQDYIDNGKYDSKIKFGTFPTEKRILCENIK